FDARELLAQAVVQILADATLLQVADLQDFPFEPLAVADVTHETGKQPLVRQPHFTDGQIHRENRAVLAQANHFAPDADDSGPTGAEIIPQVTIVLVAIRRWHEDLDVFANDLLRLVSENLFRRRVERLDDAALVDGDDSFDRRFEDGAQALFAVAQGGFGEFAANSHLIARRVASGGA